MLDSQPEVSDLLFTVDKPFQVEAYGELKPVALDPFGERRARVAHDAERRVAQRRMPRAPVDRHPYFGGKLRADAVVLQRGEQAHDTVRNRRRCDGDSRPGNRGPAPRRFDPCPVTAQLRLCGSRPSSGRAVRRDDGASRRERLLRLTGCCPCPRCGGLRPCCRAMFSTPRRRERIQENPAVLKAARTILTACW